MTKQAIRPGGNQGNEMRFPPGKTVIYCIGAQKGGTTWLGDYVAAHPQCFLPNMKECHFFDTRYGFDMQARKVAINNMKRMLEAMQAADSFQFGQKLTELQAAAARAELFTPDDRGLATYIRLLTARAGTATRLCDFTPSYATCDRTVFGYMNSLSDDARFVFILRDPIDRLWSQARMASKNLLNRNQGADFEKAAHKALRHYLGNYDAASLPRSNYRRTITELEAAVPRDRIQYLFYETLFSDAAVRQFCDFAGIAPMPADFGHRSNEGKRLEMPASIRRKLAEGLGGQYDFIRARFGDAVPAAWQDPQQILAAAPEAAAETGDAAMPSERKRA
ncbi:sulfotransferase [Mangrovicoccus algicola]|uniref:Sulfotransferase n=1 Tax=Mangrovicoccus algicola TaxID=2771008 RepID=A0A8J7CKF1_9RHOB|nr:sulfotransferase [Mangrovicoccus algicola]MBE3638731.1 sulfotransferase [Mangrovicoccus algicola]